MSMGTKRKKGYVPRRSWSIFDREAYHWAWVDKTFFGVFDCFRKDMRYCRQRIKKAIVMLICTAFMIGFWRLFPLCWNNTKRHGMVVLGYLGKPMKMRTESL